MTEENKPTDPDALEDNVWVDGIFSGGIFKPASVSEQPEVIMVRWSIYKASDAAGVETLHIVGWDGSGRASSAVQEFIPCEDHIRCRTRSGRLYELRGSPGINMDAAYVWGRWKQINKIVKDEDVSHEYYPRK